MMTADLIVSGLTENQMFARALVDSASTASFITERAAQQLTVKGQKQQINTIEIGGTQCPTCSTAVVQMWHVYLLSIFLL